MENTFNVVISIITIVIAISGSILALIQWKKSNDHKRADLLHSLICKIRDDDDISIIMDCIDWNAGLTYDGKIHLDSEFIQKIGYPLGEKDPFIKIDKTLSHFSYVCYLFYSKIFKAEDIEVFNYQIKRIMDNEHIANYLYSLFHWSKSIEVDCSFEYLIKYAIEKNYLSLAFLNYSDKGSGEYKCFLLAKEGYDSKKLLKKQ